MITINGRIFENVYTGAEWASANPVLDDRVQGFDSTLKAFKIGDGITAWNDLSYYYADVAVEPLTIIINQGSPLVTHVDMTGTDYASGFNTPKQELAISDTVSRIIYDLQIDTTFTDDTRTEVVGVDITGHEDPDNPGFTVDNILVTFFK